LKDWVSQGNHAAFVKNFIGQSLLAHAVRIMKITHLSAIHQHQNDWVILNRGKKLKGISKKMGIK
jgi:hypothetical protein